MNHHHQQYRKDQYKIYYRIESNKKKGEMYKSQTRPFDREDIDIDRDFTTGIGRESFYQRTIGNERYYY